MSLLKTIKLGLKSYHFEMTNFINLIKHEHECEILFITTGSAV